jgi:hypothetical protein
VFITWPTKEDLGLERSWTTAPVVVSIAFAIMLTTVLLAVCSFLSLAARLFYGFKFLRYRKYPATEGTVIASGHLHINQNATGPRSEERGKTLASHRFFFPRSKAINPNIVFTSSSPRKVTAIQIRTGTTQLICQVSTTRNQQITPSHART